jgi:hypothetical protein
MRVLRDSSASDNSDTNLHKKAPFSRGDAAVFSDFIIRLFLSSVNTLAFGFV